SPCSADTCGVSVAIFTVVMPRADLHNQRQNLRCCGRGIQDYWQTTVALPSRSHFGVVVGYLSDGSATVTVPVMPTRRGVLDSMAISTRFRPFSCTFFVIFP